MSVAQVSLLYVSECNTVKIEGVGKNIITRTPVSYAKPYKVDFR